VLTAAQLYATRCGVKAGLSYEEARRRALGAEPSALVHKGEKMNSKSVSSTKSAQSTQSARSAQSVSSTKSAQYTTTKGETMNSKSNPVVIVISSNTADHDALVKAIAEALGSNAQVKDIAPIANHDAEVHSAVQGLRNGNAKPAAAKAVPAATKAASTAAKAASTTAKTAPAKPAAAKTAPAKPAAAKAASTTAQALPPSGAFVAHFAAAPADTGVWATEHYVQGDGLVWKCYTYAGGPEADITVDVNAILNARRHQLLARGGKEPTAAEAAKVGVVTARGKNRTNKTFSVKLDEYHRVNFLRVKAQDDAK